MTDEALLQAVIDLDDGGDVLQYQIQIKLATAFQPVCAQGKVQKQRSMIVKQPDW